MFEEKQLLLDNDKELAEAYSALTTPKKRIRHEIEYFAKEEFESFNEIFVENTDSEQKMNLHDTCSVIINLGRWFDSEVHNIYTQINDNREISGFSKLSNSGTVVTAISELRANCVNSVTKYFEFIDEKGLVKLFNELVEYEDFTSFFMDELMAHYEIKITDSIQTKQKICTSKFAEVERLCNIFNNGGSFSYELEDKVAEFKKAMSAWDKLAQPLQVNSQQRGAEHKGSAEFVNKTRNTVIGLCNRSQDMLGKLLEQLNQFSRLMSGQSYASDAHADINAIMSAREKLPQKIKDSVKFTDIILKLLDILRTTFAENEIVAELLKKDKKDISALRTQLASLSSQIDSAQQRSSSYGGYRGGYQRSGCYIATAVYGSYDCPQVWTLRRYRDNVLRKNIFGRLFIKVYYFLSPKFIKTKFFSKSIQKFTKWVLDRKVKKLNLKGFEDTPYEDLKNK
ncbi:MAG: hypothetical protein PHN55_12560 [Dysgonamonadaceae bacterium]|nr:hypothetical protein [Dysgonamonadaceae bacterium]